MEESISMEEKNIGNHGHDSSENINPNKLSETIIANYSFNE